MAFFLALLRYNPFWKILEGYTAADVLPKAMGDKPYRMLWEPLLSNKFGRYTPKISLAWFWARITKRTTSLAYPEGGFLRFAQALAKAVEKKGGTITYNAGVESIQEKNGKILLGSYGSFDKVIVTLPSFVFTKLAPQLPASYQNDLLRLEGIGAVVVVMRLKKPFFTDNTYWLNVCDTKAPVLAIVEHTNFMDKKYYNSEHVMYLGNYLPKEHRYFSMSEKELLKEFDPYLRHINPTYADSIIGLRKFSVPFAQPIIPMNYSKMIPPFDTPIPNVYLANMQQVYPWDRGTNYAVELGEKIAHHVTKS
jgi:protoporphyrinogen oxidase